MLVLGAGVHSVPPDAGVVPAAAVAVAQEDCAATWSAESWRGLCESAGPAGGVLCAVLELSAEPFLLLTGFNRDCCLVVMGGLHAFYLSVVLLGCSCTALQNTNNAAMQPAHALQGPVATNNEISSRFCRTELHTGFTARDTTVHIPTLRP